MLVCACTHVYVLVLFVCLFDYLFVCLLDGWSGGLTMPTKLCGYVLFVLMCVCMPTKLCGYVHMDRDEHGSQEAWRAN